MSYKKELYAIHSDAQGKVWRTKIAVGTTADFTKPIGFQIENVSDEDSIDPMAGLDGSYPVINNESMRKLEGKLLTLCDATFTNKEQRESFKSIVKDNIWSMMSENVESTIAHYDIADKTKGVLTQQ